MKISFVVAVYHNEGAVSKTHEKIQSIFAGELAQHEYRAAGRESADGGGIAGLDRGR